MAKITLGPLVSDIRGTVGSLAFSIWKSGVNYVRSKTGAIANPQSAAQALVRSNLATTSQNWNNLLTSEERTAWNTWAASNPGQGENDGGVNNMIKGNSGQMSGFNAYMLSNAWLQTSGQAIVTDAPLVGPSPGIPTTVDVSFLAGTATVTWVTPSPGPVGSIVRIWGRVEGVPGHAQIIGLAAFDAGTLAITGMKFALGGLLLFTKLIGKKLYVQMDTVSPAGAKSGPSAVDNAIVA